MRPFVAALLGWAAFAIGAVACGGDVAQIDARDAATEAPADPVDPGFVGVRRLSNAEYDFTVRDLLGVSSTPVDVLPDSVVVNGFDNPAIYPTVPTEVPPPYLSAARNLAAQVFADPELRSRIMTCGPGGSSAERSTCAADIARAFGRRAFRRPLSPAEVDDMVAVATADPADDFTAAIERMVAHILSSPRFFHRIEVDLDPLSMVPHPVSPYELASRLSYLVWSTMPDPELFDLAESGEIEQLDVLTTSLRRLLADARSDRFMRRFAGQWLGLAQVLTHQVDPVAFPAFSERLAQSMATEAFLYADEFMRTRSFTEFLTADFHFIDGPLAALYGIDAPPLGDRMIRVEKTDDKRRGFLGLAGPLTLTSNPTRTSATHRGAYVVNRFFCVELAPPPAGIPALPDNLPPTATNRERIESIRAQKECATCHEVIDPIGLGMDDFDAIGRYRTEDEQGRTIDVRGTTPDGTNFQGGGELGPALAKDPRSLECAVRNVLVYATGRGLTEPGDAVIVSRLANEWKADARFEKLFEPIVTSALFRTRRGGP